MESYFTINVCAANVFKEGDFDSPVLTQGLLGETCPILEEKGKWVFIRLSDGYEGWINRFYGIISQMPYSANATCDDLNGMIYANPGLSMPLRALTFGNKIQAEKTDQGWGVTLPDGSQGWTECNLREAPRNPRRQTLVNLARKFLGIQYVWGGKSPKGFDCSGLIQTVFTAVGVAVPRDSKDQSNFFLSQTIERVKAEPGDLHFFGTNDKVTHVAMETGGNHFIHCQGWVKEESFHEDHPNFNPDLWATRLHTVSTGILIP